eukprot:INCI2469.1.p1 GENE.INCI2469.1~~INCI2469.1.p1  ORF type:complete len:416 (-),score=56.53 INCI2469.1:82-1329(-)
MEHRDTGSDGDRLVTVFMVRHGQRIDETNEGRAWQLQAGDRWYDPPLTEEGKQQAFGAASNLAKFLRDYADKSISGAGQPGTAAASDREEQSEGVVFDVFPRVFCSPLLRTLSTAEQFGRVFKMPVVPVAGLATCTAVFRKRGRKQMLLPFKEVSPLCRDAVLEEFSAAYTDMLFEPTVAMLACQAAAAVLNASAPTINSCTVPDCPSAGKAQSTRSTGDIEPKVQGRTSPKRRRAIIVVTHREGLRNTSKLTAAPFQKTKYCCTAMFNYRLPPDRDSRLDGTTTPPPASKSTELWSLAHSPESFESLQRTLRIRRKVEESEPSHAHDFQSLKRQLKKIRASIREHRACGNQRGVDGLLDKEALVVARMHTAAQASAMQRKAHVDGHRPVPIEDWNACGDEISAPPLLDARITRP